MFTYIDILICIAQKAPKQLELVWFLKVQLKMTIMIYVRSEAHAEISSSERRHFQPCQQHFCDPFSLPTI